MPGLLAKWERESGLLPPIREKRKGLVERWDDINEHKKPLISDILLGYDIFPPNFYNSYDWANCRIQVFTRDKYRCVYCGELANHVDHLNSARYYPKICLDPDNLRTACKKCHKKRHGD